MEPRPYNRAKIMRDSNCFVEKAYDDARRIAEMFFEKGEAPDEPEHSRGMEYRKDRYVVDGDVFLFPAVS